MSGGPTVLSGSNAIPNPNSNLSLTLCLTLSLTLSSNPISKPSYNHIPNPLPSRESRPFRATYYGRWWSGVGLPGVRKWTGQSGNQRDCPENKSTHCRTMQCPV